MPGEEYVLSLADGRVLRGDRLLVAAGRRPRVDGIGLETVGIAADPHGVPVDDRLRAGERLWADRRRDRQWQFTHVGQVPGRAWSPPTSSASRGGQLRRGSPGGVHRPAGGVGGRGRGAVQRHRAVDAWRRPRPTRAEYAESNGFLTLVSDGERLTGAYALGPEAGEWLQQATLAIRAAVPLGVLRDTIQPFPTFSEIYLDALKALRQRVSAAQEPVRAGSS